MNPKKQYCRQNAWKAENRDRIELVVPKGTKDKWKDQAHAEGKSLNEWLIEKISRV